MTRNNKKSNSLVIVVFCIVIVTILSVVAVVIRKEMKDAKDYTTPTTNETSTPATTTPAATTPVITTPVTTKPVSTTTNTTTKKPSTTTTSKDVIYKDDVINAYASLSYFDSSLTQRYIKYKQTKKTTYEDAIVKVNIGLDQPFYTNIKSVSNAASLSVLCNKYNSIGSYTPSNLVTLSKKNSIRTMQLRSEAASAFEKMCNDASAQGYTIKGASAYRSYSYQDRIYRNYKSADGQKKADTYSARPGHSEHQTGLAIDVQGSSGTYSTFGRTKESKWVAQNAHKYGFIVRYQTGKSSITGYVDEPWHLRFLGTDLATKVKDSGLTYDEYCAIHF